MEKKSSSQKLFNRKVFSLLVVLLVLQVLRKFSVTIGRQSLPQLVPARRVTRHEIVKQFDSPNVFQFFFIQTLQILIPKGDRFYDM